MPDPIVHSCPVNDWVLVAENVTTGIVHRLSDVPSDYLQTYRITGELAPTDNSDGAILFEHTSAEDISSTFGIDVYVKALGEDGSVRADT